MSRIAVDAMGGDNAPTETVAGAVMAATAGIDVVLVGDRSVIASELAGHGVDVPVVHAPQTIEMHEEVTRALREKPDSSVSMCARLIQQGEVAGFVSAGSTGAAMAAAALLAGRLPGVLRPTIATILPTPGSPMVLLDSGANPDVKVEHLVQFAVMGSVFAEVYFGLERPRVGLLNIGEEAGKGRQLEKDAHAALAAADLRFVGNIEGRTMAKDEVDVLVTDGFTGNVMLKTVEGSVTLALHLVDQALADAGIDARQAMRPVVDRLDYENTGGAHLLGVGGVVVISHGSSTRRSIASALRLARDGADRGLAGRVAERIGRT